MRISLATVLALACVTARAADYDCVIEARQNIEIRSPVEGVIATVPVRRGDFVQEGQVLATLASGPERAAVDLARSRAEMQGEIKAADARVDLARKKLDRVEELQKQSFVSMSSRDEAEAEHRLAVEELRRATENQRLAQFDLSRAEEILNQRTIRSPFSGVVVEVKQKPGELATSNLKDPILRLAEIEQLNVEVVLPVSLYGSVKTGSRAIVKPEKPVGGRYTATVEVVDEVIDAASGTFGVRLTMSNSRRRIPAGIRCRVRFR